MASVMEEFSIVHIMVFPQLRTSRNTGTTRRKITTSGPTQVVQQMSLMSYCKEKVDRNQL